MIYLHIFLALWFLFSAPYLSRQWVRQPRKRPTFEGDALLRVKWVPIDTEKLAPVMEACLAAGVRLDTKHIDPYYPWRDPIPDRVRVGETTVQTGDALLAGPSFLRVIPLNDTALYTEHLTPLT